MDLTPAKMEDRFGRVGERLRRPAGSCKLSPEVSESRFSSVPSVPP